MYGAGCEPHVLQIVMLPPRAHALLRSRSPVVVALLQPKKHVLELIHPRIRKQQRRVVLRDKGRRMDDLVSLFLKKPEKCTENFRSSRHGNVILNDTAGNSGAQASEAESDLGPCFISSETTSACQRPSVRQASRRRPLSCARCSTHLP